MTGMQVAIKEADQAIKRLRKALELSKAEPGALDARLEAARQELLSLDGALYGNRSMREVGDPYPHTVQKRVSAAMSTS